MMMKLQFGRRGLPEAVVLTLAVWLVSTFLWGSPDLMVGVPLRGTLGSLLAVTFFIGIAFSVITYVLIEISHAMPRWWRISLIAVVVFVLAIAHGWIDALILVDLKAKAGNPGVSVYKQFLTGLMPFVLVYSLHATVLGLMLSGIAVQEQQRLLADAQAAAQAAQLAVLRFQLNPHFLFNTLNAISSLIVTGDNVAAEAMTVKLAYFLQTSLQADPQGQVTLDDELATIHTYLDIEAVRFGDRLIVQFECPAPLLAALVPSFLLQPLVENAVKYAVAPSRRPVTISVTASRDAQDIILVVEDDGGQAFGALPKGGTGLGIDNVRRRLLAFYGGRGTLEATAREHGFQVTLRLPFRVADSAGEAA